MISEKQTRSTQRGFHCVCPCEWWVSPCVGRARAREGAAQSEAGLEQWLSERPCPAVSPAPRSSITVTPPSSPCPIHHRGSMPHKQPYLPPGACIPGPAETIFEVKSTGSALERVLLPFRLPLTPALWEGEAIKEQLEKQTSSDALKRLETQPWHCRARLGHCDLWLSSF